MTDKELLELAAKAAGYTLKWGETYLIGNEEIDCTDLPFVVSGQPDEADWHWNPLYDDGDAFQLAVKLGLDINHTWEVVQGDDNYPMASVHVSLNEEMFVYELKESDSYAATRRAIVRAAAAIGVAE